MPSARVPIPPYLLSQPWASAALPSHHIRAVLRLPGELRPIALRSFHSIAYRAHLQQIAAHELQHKVPLNGLNKSRSFLARKKRKDGNGRTETGPSGGLGGVEDAGNSGDFVRSNGKGEKGGFELVKENKLPAKTSALPENTAHQLSFSLLLTQPPGDIPDEVQRLISAVLERNPATDTDIINTYNEYRNALKATDFGFIAQHFPKAITPLSSSFFGGDKKWLGDVKGERRSPLLALVLADISNVELSAKLETALKDWCRFLATPVFKWCQQLTGLETPDSGLKEISKIVGDLSTQRFLTTESISQAYLDYREKLLATSCGYIFNDFPAEFRSSEFDRFNLLRGRVDRERILFGESINVETDVADSALITQILNLKMRKMAMKPLGTLIAKYWELELGNKQLGDAFRRLRQCLDLRTFKLPKHLNPKTLKALNKFREDCRERLIKMQAVPDTVELMGTRNQLQNQLAALDEFFQVVEDNASFEPTRGGDTTATMPVETKCDRPADRAAAVAHDHVNQHKLAVPTSSPAKIKGDNNDTPRHLFRSSPEDHTRSQGESLSSSEATISEITSDIITPRPINQSGSDSATISELRSHIAELKDLVRGLIFQQISRPAEPPTSSIPISIPPEVMGLLSDGENSDSAFERIIAEPTSTPATATKSLLEELFPEETKQVLVKEISEQPDTPPRIPVPHVPFNSTAEAGVTYRKVAEHSGKRRPMQKAIPLTDTSTVLELRFASKSLTEEDFRRLIPRGLHMQEWTRRGEFVKVFPKRDPRTLEKLGNYYIIFRNGKDAEVYREHVHHVHDLARQHTPTSLTSERPPPPGYVINGEDVSALVQSFSLIPPQQKLYLHYLSPPFTPFQQNIFKRGGYAQILGEGREGIAQVMVEFLAGRQPSWFDIHDAIYLDGRRRGLEWKLLPGESSIRKVDMNQRTKKDENSALEDEDETEPDVEDALSDLQLSGTENGGKRKKTVKEQAKTPAYGQRWILSFESVEEANRFALAWHGRAFPWHGRALKKWQDKGFGEQTLMVNAEFLW